MDRDDLRARLNAATISWRHDNQPHTTSSAKEAHARLLTSLDTLDRKGPGHQISPGDIRQLIAQLREIAIAQVNLASESFRELVETHCCFEYEQENMGGERHRVNLRIDEVPFLDDIRTALPLISSFSELPQPQQAHLARLLEEEKTVRHFEVRLQLERQDGTAVGQVQRELPVASAKASLNRTLVSISPSGLDWLAMHRDSLNLLGWSNLTLPVLGATRFAPEQLLQASESLGLLSDCLIMPFPLEPKAPLETRKRWLQLWEVCEEAAENLSMVAAWMRCLGSTGEYKRCRVCFRHVGEGMKKNCWLHQRTAKVRVPSRELHVSDLYHVGWQQAAEHHAQIRTLLDDASPTKEMQERTLRAAERERLAPEVTRAAATLAALLQSLLPLMEPRLRARIKSQFDQSVAEAQKLCMARYGVSRDEAFTPPGQALSGLRWEKFFGDFFASKMTIDAATSFAAGKMIDIDHPLASTREAFTEQKLALDLLHLSVWIAVDMTFDAYGYLNVDAIRRDRERAGAQPTYQELAQIHGATPQAIHQALTQSRAGSRRSRILNQGRTKLRSLLAAQRKML
ncbi:hypothetical protein [Comamonas antarctica]|uniref:hypothetical protein n=1 Tax=Comamonas antarctica TaxID=2743470 RepID=UPI0028EB6456|nr:hypothetical protein [Comamonas antarctica]